jgi:hypothetical protein
MLYSPSTTNVWFDHGIGYTPLGWPYDNEFHYMVCDSNNDFMFDYQIFQATPANNNYFSYISTCMSADLNSGSALDPSYTGTYGLNNGYGESGNIIGMPFAWTHRLTTSNPSPNEMSIDGFWSPDPGAYCYIGFPWGSPALEQTLSSQWSSTYAMFVYSFFDYALNWHFTVHDALNSAANDCFSPQLFFNCPP